MELIARANKVIYAQRERNRALKELRTKVANLETEVRERSKELDCYMRAASLMGTVSDNNITATLNKITTVINKALRIIYPENVREVEIRPSMYNNLYQHFDVILHADGVERAFDQSGSGLGEVVSFLFLVCLIDISGGRKIMVMDEIMNGLHPDAKYIIRDMMLALSKKFNFLFTEYNLDVGVQYEVINQAGTAHVELLEGGTYYADRAIRNKERMLKKAESIA